MENDFRDPFVYGLSQGNVDKIMWKDRFGSKCLVCFVDKSPQKRVKLEYVGGYVIWYYNGKLHNINGPAIIWEDGTPLWYIDGKQLTEEKFNKWRANNE